MVIVGKTDGREDGLNNAIQSWKTDPNRTSGKIKLADCQTTVLLVSNLNFSQPTKG